MDRVRPYLPVVQALTGSSPFHEGSDTGYDSFRTLWFARWPITGSTELLGDGKTYQDVVESLQVAGVIDDASNLYWDVRPSMRYPTLEFRVADVCTFLDDAVLHVALVRALSRVLAERASHGVPPHLVRPEVLRAARWRGRGTACRTSCSTRSPGCCAPPPTSSGGCWPSCATTSPSTASGTR